MSARSDAGMSQRVPAHNQFDSGTRILVIEDSPSARKLIQDVLLRLGVGLSDLRMAGTVPEALQLYAQWRPEVVFIDLRLQLPGDAPATTSTGPSTPTHYPKNGGELAIQLLQRNPALKIVICTASDPASSEVADLVKKGKVQSIVKPILAARVREILEKFEVSLGPPPPRR
jgi:CheY-like chemotaxis protein